MGNKEEKIKRILTDFDKDGGTDKKYAETIVSDILAVMPSAEPDRVFRANLQARLLFKAREMKGKNASWIWGLTYGFGGAFATAAILFVVFYATGWVPFPKKASETPIFSPLIKIASVSENSFGSLDSAEAWNGGTFNEMAFIEDTNLPEEPQSALSAAEPAAPMLTADNSPKAFALAPRALEQRKTYRRVYKGEGLSELPSKMEVLKRADLAYTKEGDDQKEIKNYTYIDKNSGYVTDINADKGTMSIFREEFGPEPPSIEVLGAGEKPETDLSDEEILRSVKDFLSEYSVSFENYGEPEISRGFSTAQVFYPVLINGKNVFDENLEKTGMTAVFEYGTKTVNGVWNIAAKNYESSLYPVETDGKKIISAAEGSSAPLGEEIEVKEPVLIYIVAQRRDKNGRTEEFLIPAYLFNGEIPRDGRVKIPVPLVKEIFDKQVKKDN